MIGFSKDKKLELNWEMKGNHYIPISVIVPVYNIEKYLERCVQSICNQTYQKLEIILVDDGSTDGSGVKEYAPKTDVPDAFANGVKHTIGWTWAFERGDDEGDTALGNKAITELEALKLAIKITIEQIDTYPSN